MTADDLNAPLGQHFRKRRLASPISTSQAIAVGLALFLGVFVVWAMMGANPFGRESLQDGSRVIVRISRQPPDAEVVALLERRGGSGEKVTVVDGDLWVHFPIEPNQSKLIGALTTKNLGVGTLRNWNTVRRLGETITE